MASGVRFTVEQQDLQRVIASIKLESDGKELKRELGRELKAIAEPAAKEARAAILAMPTFHATHGDMRQAIATKTTVKVTTVGRNTDVRISAPRTGYPNKFTNAARNYNLPGWRHPVFGDRQVWADEIGQPGWFDRVREHKAEYVAAIEKALKEMAERIAARHG